MILGEVFPTGECVIFRRVKKKNSSLGLLVGASQVAVALLQRDEETLPHLHGVQMGAVDDVAVLGQLSETLRNPSHQCVSTTTVLAPGSYVLHQVEPPAVPANEVKDAVRWLLRDVLDVPLEQVQVDLFPLPFLPSQKKLGYAVAASKDKIQSALGMVDTLGLSCKTIDIAELCLARLLSQVETDKAVAGLLLAESSGLLVVLWEGAVIMARSLYFAGVEGAASPQDLEQLALDIQRSLDFCESTLTRRPVREVILLPSRRDADEIASGLSPLLTPDVHVLRLENIVRFANKPETYLPAPCLLALGAALREARV